MRATQAAPARADDRALVLDGSVIGWERLHPAMAEAAGRTVIEELALDRSLERAASRAGIEVTEAMIRAEEDALLDELGGVAGDRSRMEVLGRIRQTRGLGPNRYAGLLRRNATLRALVGQSAEPTEVELSLARSIAFGEARRARVFVSPSDSEAGRVREAVLAAEVRARPWVFAERCVASTHPSAERGGLVARFSPDDPAYPDVVRDAGWELGPGEVSRVLATQAGFVVLLVESEVPAVTPSDADIARVDRRVRVRKERLAMERLAADLLGGAGVRPVDPDLARAWRGE